MEDTARAPRPSRSLLTRLVGSFLGVTLLTVLSVSLVAFDESRRALRDVQLDRLESAAAVMERELIQWVDMQENVVVLLASLPQLQALFDEHRRRDSTVLDEVGSILGSAASTAGEFEELDVLAERAGEVIVSTNPSRVGDYHVTDLYFARGKAQTFVQSVYTSPLTGRPALTIATPIRMDDGTLVGVLAGHLDLSRFDQVALHGQGLDSRGEAYLVSSFGDFVSSRRFGRSEFRRGVSSVGIDAALERRSGVGVYKNYAGVAVIGAYRWNDALGLALVVEIEEAPTFAPVRSLLASMLSIGLVSALVLAILVTILSGRIAGPVLALARGAARVASGDFDTIMPVTSHDEVGVLARAFNDMTARLRDLYQNLSEQVEAKTRAMAELEKSKQLLQTIIDNSHTLICVVDLDGRFLLVNRGFETLAASRGDRSSLPPELVGSARESRLEGKVVEREVDLTLGNERRTFFVVCFPLVDESDAPYAVGVVGSDLTERIHAFEAQKLLEAQVLHAQKLESLGLMAGGIAHDFNNILTTLSGNAELALTVTSEPKARDHLEKVLSATRQAAELTGQMLAYAGRTGFDRDDVDLNDVISEVVPLLSASVPKKVTLTCRLSRRSAVVHANRAQIIQLVMNLATNAAEAIGDRPGTVTLSTRVGEAVVLEVRDDGAGMDPETRARVFDPFFSTKGPGRGIGLAAVLGIVKAASGSLSVSSEGGKGTTFVIEFPPSKVKPFEAQAVAPAAKADVAGATVLVVDDESLVRDVTRKFLELGGYRVLEASNGQEAVDAYRRLGREIDVVLIDLTMPVMNGVEALAAIREIDPSARALLTSGYDARGALASAGTVREDVLQKPYRARSLLSRIERLLGD